jgi:uncharacterized membrane protein YsdA (DUF1294 family)
MGTARHRPVKFHFTLALILVTLTAIAFWYYWFKDPWRWWAFLGSWLVAINVWALFYYGADKFQARRQGRRVPEPVLHSLAVAGGSPGAYVAMKVFRHKTLKGEFRLVFWFIVILQTALVLWLAYLGLRDRLG